MTNINLSLKRVYYDLIDKGLKTFEYRDVNEYYTERLTTAPPKDGKEPKWAKVDTVTFYCGNAPSMVFKVKKMSLYPSNINPTHYCIHLGERIKTKE